MAIISELSKSLSKTLNWNKARVNCLTRMVLSLLKTRTVNLAQWAVVFGDHQKQASAYMRIRRFFRGFPIDFDVIAGLLFKCFGFGNQKMYLTMDRTNWQFGKQKINVLMLGVVYKGIAIPLYWSLLNKKGNSNYDERVALVNRFTKRFGSDRIAGLLGDREFLGKKWFKYLKQQKIPYYIRIRENLLVDSARGHLTNAKFLFMDLEPCEQRVLEGKRWVSDIKLYIAGAKCPDGQYLIVATTEKPDDAIAIYGKRWQVETLFGCLKTRGFNFEATHMTHQQRLEKLIAVMAIAFAWAHKIGEWCHTVKPIKMKKHTRKSESIFHYGLRTLRQIILNNPGTRLIQKTFRVFEAPPDQLQNLQLGVPL